MLYPERDEIISNYRDRIRQGRRTRLSKAEFDILVDTFIESLTKTKTRRALKQLCDAEISLLEEGYPKQSLASSYIPRYRAAIEEAIALNRLKLSPRMTHIYEHEQRVTGIKEMRKEHWALTYFKYSLEEYEQLDKRQAKPIRKRRPKLKTVQLDQYLEAIAVLSISEDKFAVRHQGLAIAAMSGLRMSEVLSEGNFNLTTHPHLLRFISQTDNDGYDIVTLLPAKDLLEQIHDFRSLPEIRALMQLEGDNFKTELNKFEMQLNRECNRYLTLTEIVPPWEGRTTVTVHNLRSLWEAIAVHYFCPATHDESAFLQCLNQMISPSTSNPKFRYQLVNSEGVVLQDKGVKLDLVPEILWDEAERDMKEEQLTIESEGIEEIGDPIESELEQSISHKFAAIRSEWRKFYDELEARMQKLETKPSSSDDSVNLSQLRELEEENDRLKAEQQRLQQELDEANGKLAQFRQLLLSETIDEALPTNDDRSLVMKQS